MAESAVLCQNSLQNASECITLSENGGMAMALSTISARIETKDKERFDKFCKEVGLSTSSALNLFVKAVLRENRIPFDVAAQDPFYSESNMKFLEEGAAAIKAGKGVVHELIEVGGDDEEELV